MKGKERKGERDVKERNRKMKTKGKKIKRQLFSTGRVGFARNAPIFLIVLQFMAFPPKQSSSSYFQQTTWSLSRREYYFKIVRINRQLLRFKKHRRGLLKIIKKP